MFQADKDVAAEELCRRVGFDPKIIPFKYDNFHSAVEPKIIKMVGEGNVFPPSMILAGPVGVGKSGLLSAAFKDWFIRTANWTEGTTAGQMITGCAKHCLFLTYADFVDIVMAPQDTGGMAVDDLKRVNFLIMDDLLNGGQSPYQIQRLEELIAHRHGRGMATWFSANISARDMKSMVGFERSYSRLADKAWCRYFELVGIDRRSAKKIAPAAS